MGIRDWLMPRRQTMAAAVVDTPAPPEIAIAADLKQ
jgi:hypothetical protein